MKYPFTTTEEVIQSYADYLLVKDRRSHDRFEKVRTADRESVLAEAIVFSILQSMNLRPEVHDQVGTGGADFLCGGSSPETKVIVEATTLNPDAITKRSNLPNTPPEHLRGGPFGLVTRNICNKAKAKNEQLAGYAMPRVLAIASGHEGIAAVFNAATATYALVSEPHWRGGLDGEFTDLRDAVFFRPGEDETTIVACRKNISAILLIAVYGDQSQVYGILHPEPEYSLNFRLFQKVPFVRLASWPVTGGRLSTEWVMGEVDGYSASHSKVRLPDLRGGFVSSIPNSSLFGGKEIA
jgi:hypothetical protein